LVVQRLDAQRPRGHLIAPQNRTKAETQERIEVRPYTLAAMGSAVLTPLSFRAGRQPGKFCFFLGQQAPEH
jgi:hypothetical protein